MKNGYYLSAYIHIDELYHILGITKRHDQNISLWKKKGVKIELVHYWELERLSGIKHHDLAFANKKQAVGLINKLLGQYQLTINDINEIWGTPELFKGYIGNKYQGIKHDNFTQFSLHSLAHLFTSVLLDSELFYHNNLIGLAIDGGSDNVADPDAYKKSHYCGSVSKKGNLQIFSVLSPGYFWHTVSDYYQLREGTLMALAYASKSEAYINNENTEFLNNPPEIKNYVHLEYLKQATKHFLALIKQVHDLTINDAGKLFNYFDTSFTELENKISMIMKYVQNFSLKIMDKNIINILNSYQINPKNYYLAMAGGYGLNCPTNTYLMKKYSFKGFLAPPCIGDSGQSLGYALLEFYKNIKNFKFKFKDAFYGTKYDGFKKILTDEKYKDYIINIKKFKPKLVVKDLINQPVIWFEGRSEIGPRALGHRSIIADPRRMESKKFLNKIKQRQWWRPVAPMIIQKYQADWFENSIPSPYMLITLKIQDNKTDQIPAVKHLNNTARIQTVEKKNHALIYKIITEFRKKTGIPLICNTSLNDKGEPIIETIEEAVSFALRKNIKIIYINGIRVELNKHKQYKCKKPLPRSSYFTDFYDKGKKQKLLKLANPHNIPIEYIKIYFSYYQKYIPVKSNPDLTDPEDCRFILMAGKLREKFLRDLHYHVNKEFND